MERRIGKPLDWIVMWNGQILKFEDGKHGRVCVVAGESLVDLFEEDPVFLRWRAIHQTLRYHIAHFFLNVQVPLW